jgi:ribosomal subunit interface protein
MAGTPTLVLHLKSASSNDSLREHVETRIEALSNEFPEVTRFEITLSEEATGYTAHARVTGKNTEVAPHAAGAPEPRPALDALLDKIQRQLRRAHDKRIFSQRRNAQRDPPKRKTQP